MKALIIGSTGATGTELTKQLIEQEEFTEVHVFVRNVPTINHPKLNVHKVDFSEISSWSDQLKGDVLFLAMGTTLKTAKRLNIKLMSLISMKQLRQRLITMYPN